MADCSEYSATHNERARSAETRIRTTPRSVKSCSLEQGNQHGVIGILARILVLDSLRALPPF